MQTVGYAGSQSAGGRPPVTRGRKAARPGWAPRATAADSSRPSRTAVRAALVLTPTAQQAIPERRAGLGLGMTRPGRDLVLVRQCWLASPFCPRPAHVSE